MNKFLTTLLVLMLPMSLSAKEELFIYNWSDYIAEDTIANFEEETGIDVTYDVFDSNEVLEAKLLAGGSGYDLVVPSGSFMENQIKAGVFQKLDKSMIPNLKNLDPSVLEKTDAHDPGGEYSVNYMYGTTGIGYNVAAVEERGGDVESWDIIFDVDQISKYEEKIYYRMITPRSFEAIAMKTVQVMYPGKYSGILEPWRHYIPINRDFSNLNEVIDQNYYPVPEARNSNLRHRPIGIGVQGLADAFINLRLPFTSPEARKLNKDIFETIYFSAVSASCDLAKIDGPYETFKGSPISKGEFQYNLWGIKDEELSGRWDWSGLRKKIKKHGVRNSLLLAPMPTASTSQILGNNECFEPYTSNLYTRRVLSGEFIVVNKHLLLDLVNLGLWNEDVKNAIMANNGSIQSIEGIPDNIKLLYKTVWELSMKDIIDMSADRGAFIDQSQSLNLFVESPNMGKLTSMHFYAWKKGLKTGMYYLRTKAASSAIKFTVKKKEEKTPEKEVFSEISDKKLEKVSSEPVKSFTEEEILACSIDNPDDCEACGS